MGGRSYAAGLTRFKFAKLGPMGTPDGHSLAKMSVARYLPALAVGETNA
ncbi:MAG: hypothetical protein RL514_1988 [Verrucomicrobiota bacterium]|jgi:hypothetical protein